jgi:sucrose-6-phosphate hydrolase SacC (GH32 family)
MPVNRARQSLLFIACWLTFLAPALAQRDDILIADFEGDDYEAWKAEGDALGKGPARGTLPNQMPVEGFHGKRLVNTYHGGDDTTGTLTSPEFKIERKYLSFLIGGGGWEGKTCLNLLVKGKVVRAATGPNTKAGGSERLERQRWDVSDLEGQTAQLQIVDEATGGWGHINVDHILLTDKPPPVLLTNATRKLTDGKPWLQFPVKNGAVSRKVKVLVDGKVARFFDIELADDEPDWWASLDVSAWQGKQLEIQVDRLPDDSQALKQLKPADEMLPGKDLYHEPLRPQFHFSARRGWVNDPNGLVFFRGEYHLFFQHNPYGWNWGNMHWGHAVSKDLMHWKELGEALYPDDMGPMFSGSAVVDVKNTSGFGKDGQPPLVLFYTAAGSPTVQALAYSLDGRTFTKYDRNPIVPEITGGNRDPKVIWHEPSQRWVMVLYVALAGERHTIHFFTSPNLRDWKLASITEGGQGGDKFLFECPDFFELPVVGEKERKWVLTAANSESIVGSFDGTKFTSEGGRLPGMQGQGFYAAQTFSDEPKGRRIQIGWGQMPSPGMPFNQLQTIPCGLTLRRIGKDLRLCRWPVDEVNSLHGKTHSHKNVVLKSDANPLRELRGDLWDISAELEASLSGEAILEVRGIPITLRLAERQLVCQGQTIKLGPSDRPTRMRVLVDRTSLEIFVNQGEVAAIFPILPKADNHTLRLVTKEGTVKVSSLEVTEMRSAWSDKP